MARAHGAGLVARAAVPSDAAAIAGVYSEGIEDRLATFETRPRTAVDVVAWFDGRHPIVVVEDASVIVGFAATYEYRPRACYAGVMEFSVYVGRAARGRGVGRLARPARGSLSRGSSRRTRRADVCFAASDSARSARTSATAGSTGAGATC